ncbi:Uncharacterised protein [Citrobacter werkmanii]|uniref:Uncharacterized protein n=1 Tax=Citrobacter werkmanii TaxID=67827 RepID=A0A9N8CRY4_9ENTR|nr:hypothetical protein [Citrobacter werkmanii]CAB5540532.1 Uncharacterised protein [Citrobacter werkmanii]CAB5546330.1 Uncharacterised protein [Citrobacter werkmanii]CAB5548798.1 Uncharacterised protein [Citrobacter werkmanii]CAB5568431.1 Uncharacterised protein [Citrobacter werkmanii]CAB5575531.1 Uncharacterised protein [Citrobacter werkmanii]
MTKISFEVVASDATIKPDDYRNIRVEVDGVELSELLESIEDNDSVIDTIGAEVIAEFFSTESRLFDLLEKFDASELADFLRERGWEVANESDN